MTQGTKGASGQKNTGSRSLGAMRPFRPDMKRRAREEGQAGRFKWLSVTPGSARTSLHPRLLSCHHYVVRRRGFGVSAMTFEIFEISNIFG